MKKTTVLIIIAVLLLILAACGDTRAPHSDGEATTSQPQSDGSDAPQYVKPIIIDDPPTARPSPSDAASSSASSETAEEDEVGTFLYLGLPGYIYFEEPDYSFDQFYSATVIFSGDLRETRGLDVTEFTVYIDGEPQPYNASNVWPGEPQYEKQENFTTYGIDFETVGIIPHTVSKLWIEAVINGSTVRSQTHEWLENGQVVMLDDGSVSPPLQLEQLPEMTLEEFLEFHTITDDEIPDNGTPPRMPEWLESHRGDKGYFYVTSDDYIIARQVDPESTTYVAYSFEGGICTEYLQKEVYLQSAEERLTELFTAYTYPRDVRRDIKFIDNVRYEDWADSEEDVTGLTRDEILRSRERNESLFENYEFYDSKA